MTFGETVTLWTVQHECAWEKAKATGLLRPDGRRVQREYRMPYRWLMKQMTQRVPTYNGGYPLWAWYSSEPNLQLPQLSKGTRGVSVEFTADSSYILISDFEAWHSVLSGQYLSLTEEEDRSFHEDNEYFCVWRDAERDPERAELVIQSWERIFDIELLGENAQWRGTGDLQATLGKISLEQVLTVTPFIAR